MFNWKRNSFNAQYDTITIKIKATFSTRYEKDGKPDHETVRTITHHEIREFLAGRLSRQHGIKIEISDE